MSNTILKMRPNISRRNEPDRAAATPVARARAARPIRVKPTFIQLRRPRFAVSDGLMTEAP